jgi:hypothetical protein
VRFERTYLTPVAFAVAAGEERLLDLRKILGRLEFELIGAAQPDHFDLLDADSGNLLARIHGSHGPFYGVMPGRYRLRFHTQGPPEVKVVIAAGQRTRVIPAKTEAFPEGYKEEADGTRLPVHARVGDTIIELTWIPPERLEVAGYRVYRAGSDRPIHGQRLLSRPSFLDIGLSNGRTYTYIVTAVLADGTEWKGYQQVVSIPGTKPD